MAACMLFALGGVFLSAQEGKISEDIYPSDYLPFVGVKTAALDDPANIRFNSDLPRLDGATAAYPLYAAFVQALYPEGDYRSGKVLKLSRTNYAYEALVEGRADIIFCYAPSAEQKQLAAKRGLRYRMVPICRDAFVFFVNRDNPVRDLPLRHIRDIYSGRVSNWKDLGGNNARIIAFQRNRGSGSQTAFLNIMKGETIMEPLIEEVALSMADLIEKVADYRNHLGALGYSFRFFTQEMARNDAIRLLSIDGISPTVENIQNDVYLFTETLYAITTGSESPNVQKLLDWIVSEQGQRLIEKTGYVPIRKNP
jgi:phosphate transport system substrate-binding protein